jgi:dolichyl-phosphate-mannose--protein O-mannosyl transferase
MPTLEKYLGQVYIWHYVPNLAAAIAFAAIFFLATLAHTYKMVRTSMWISLPFVIGGICMFPTPAPDLHFLPDHFNPIAAQLN